ncbi:TPA: hypothetical protein KNR57_003507 [Clostridioides difficile]|uniref:hypothetical protein n=1 Tax=Clostridioides difficile TaxID=1496 RepID=UPI001A20B0CC|nr:hypothetical protein [Clostridioides difficile]EIS9859132.1 hypothetical protein [Clostridioides difficile]EJA6764410.1 hypothetical protein [Clostridioides difficile]KAK2209576.1 hypothetical protein XC23_20045 [Clostridioides difficile]KAK2221210.1 hypothetical protein XC24_19800 [Clostridioides difficile]KAK2229040.1 hypothetical protein XC24_05885 [Clostridioides difficile]
MKMICHMSILERAEFTDKIANAIMSTDENIGKGDAFVDAIEVVKQMERRENETYKKGDIAI